MKQHACRTYADCFVQALELNAMHKERVRFLCVHVAGDTT